MQRERERVRELAVAASVPNVHRNFDNFVQSQIYHIHKYPATECKQTFLMLGLYPAVTADVVLVCDSTFCEESALSRIYGTSNCYSTVWMA